ARAVAGDDPAVRTGVEPTRVGRGRAAEELEPGVHLLEHTVRRGAIARLSYEVVGAHPRIAVSAAGFATDRRDIAPVAAGDRVHDTADAVVALGEDRKLGPRPPVRAGPRRRPGVVALAVRTDQVHPVAADRDRAQHDAVAWGRRWEGERRPGQLDRGWGLGRRLAFRTCCDPKEQGDARGCRRDPSGSAHSISLDRRFLVLLWTVRRSRPGRR